MPIQSKQQPPYYTTGLNEIKRYVAIITQTSTEAPTAIVLQNTLGTAVTFRRSAEGVYWIKATNTTLFDITKTTYIIGSPQASENYFTLYHSENLDNELSLTTWAGINETDNMLLNTTLEINVYQ